MSGSIEIRRTSADDLPEVFSLLRASLGWNNDPRFEALFEWKHRRNPFGPSPAWVALDGARVVGFRTLLRWEFQHAATTVHAVRPVDTATHPDYQGRGIFKRLTLHALDEVAREGVDLVFNTPNNQSRPGYLKMGWESLGKLTPIARPTRISRAWRILSARVPADRWTTESHVGTPAPRVFENETALDALIANCSRRPTLRTRLTPEFLRWRYGEPLLGYRAVVAPEGLAQGVAILRVRRRGSAREAALCDVLAPDGNESAGHALVREVLASVDADYVLGLPTSSTRHSGLWRVPGQGPVLTARALAEHEIPPRTEWELTLGDIELF